MVKKNVQYFAYCVLVVAVVGALGVSIATLVEVLNQNDKKNDNTSPLKHASNVNIENPKQIAQGHKDYEGYKSAVELLKSSINTKVNPCNDFYRYTCSNLEGERSFTESEYENRQKMVEKFKDKSYLQKAPGPVQTMAKYYEKCVATRMNWDEQTKDGAVIMKSIRRLAAGKKNYEDRTKFPFYMLYQHEVATENFNRDGLAFLLGNSIGVDNVVSLISVFVDNNWKDPYSKDGYSLFIDQPTTIIPYKYHIRAWDNAKERVKNSTVKTMRLLAASQGITLDRGKLDQDIDDVLEFDHVLATQYSTDDTTRRNFERSYNLMTLHDLENSYRSITWRIFIEEITQLSPDIQKRLLQDVGEQYPYQFIVAEPGMMLLLNNLFSDKTSFSARTVVNYIYLKLVLEYSDFLPKSSSLPEFMLEPPQFAGPRHILKVKKGYKRQQLASTQEAEFSCVGETTWNMMHANARLFIDKVYPTEASRRQLKERVGEIVSFVSVGFRSMIDQLNWMTQASKTAAYRKIDHLVINIGYPEWITIDAELVRAHKDLDIMDNDNYFTMVEKLRLWKIKNTWSMLFNKSVDRERFDIPAGTTNAWYQPQANSITLPAAILHQPFYDPSWPAALNFGCLGLVAGHEITHGFDDEGVQWDETGILNGWMDSSSTKGFRQMADCVVHQYNHFCPLNETNYGRKVCVDGAMTQGENIADSGGVQSAYRAYRNYINLKGPDAQLPDDVLQEFTADQLFFLGFARVWCQKPSEISTILNKLLTDVHSPGEYRVWGAMQNNPAFKDAFHCPSTSYAPDKHCNVWVSEMDHAGGVPDAKNELNIRENKRITPKNVEEYAAYKTAVDFFKESVNVSADPCTDFFQYACGKYDKPVSFGVARAKILEYMVDKLYGSEYDTTVQKSEALKKVKMFTDACVEATKDSSENQRILETKNYLLPRVKELEAFLGSRFTYVFGGKVTSRPNKVQLANALGYMSFDQGIDTLVTQMVDTNWPEPTKGYFLFLDQNTAYMGKSYYDVKAFKTIKESYVNSATDIIATFARAQRIPTDKSKLKENIRGLIEFEQMIALNYSSDEDLRRTYKRSWNLRSIAEMSTYSFVDWSTYLKHVPKVAQAVIQDQRFKVSVYEPEQYKKMSADYETWDQTKLVNYLFMRLILSNAQYLPSYADSFREMPEEPIVLGRRRRPYFRFERSDNLKDVRANCVGLANELMQYGTGRVYVDYLYPNEAKKKLIREKVGGMMQNVVHSFQGMLASLDWMTEETKKVAHEKTLGIVQNIAFPDWIMDNAKLDEYYKDFIFDQTHDNYYDMWTKLTKYNIALMYKQLTAKESDRYDFIGQPGTVNAWYMPEANSITFPAGILQPPYFHPHWPTSVNYGALGVVAGHELTHGFDDMGVQWGPLGALTMNQGDGCLGWMDKNTTTGFLNMAQCVINEYNQFCPLDSSKFTPNCVNGKNTQGENIADNGGIHAAYRAYKDHVELNGPDPLLPDRFFVQYTHDQLFFLSFAQVWCERRRTDEKLYQQLMVDPHSPTMYRVFGTLQNHPAFRAAYNCPLESLYAPVKHCSVWVPNYAP